MRNRLNQILVEQAQNELFYDGNVHAAARVLVKQVADALETDRCSLWLYPQERTHIELQQIYYRATDEYHSGGFIYREGCEPYFEALDTDPVIVADDAITHPATSCFSDNYLKKLGIRSMLDVPVWHRGRLIGVICIESMTKREWKLEEIDFAQLLSAMYSFSHSVNESNLTWNTMLELEKFIDAAALISKADKLGNITYVNDKFTEVSGWTLEECIGKNHNIVNSGIHPKEFWADMYKTVVKEKRIWNGVVTNRSKNGDLYYVDSYIKAEFDSDGKVSGFLSIRQDVTSIAQLNDKLNNLLASQTSYVLRTDMQGRHTYWNQKFEDEFGWVYDGNMMHGNSLLSICESHHGAAYNAVMECIAAPGKIVKVELDKPHRDGSRRTTLWEFVCLTDKSGKPLEIQCMGIDITDRVKAERQMLEALTEVEKKNAYLEHAAKILRHDMHSGINTYMPRGVNSLERRLSPEIIASLGIEAPLKMVKEGLRHTQKVYKGVYEFTNLVKSNSNLNKESYNLRDILIDYLTATAYRHMVQIEDLGSELVNEPLFCTAIDNLVRNGLKYNDSNSKLVKIYREENLIHVQDNGRGLTQEEFIELSKPYTRKPNQAEAGSGLGLNIAIAILEEHGFKIRCSRLEEESLVTGTKITIEI